MDKRANPRCSLLTRKRIHRNSKNPKSCCVFVVSIIYFVKVSSEEEHSDEQSLVVEFSKKSLCWELISLTDARL